MSIPAPIKGYSYPQAARDLIEHANAHGWDTKAVWATDNAGAPYVEVNIRRKVRESESARVYADTYFRGPLWYYQITWHRRGCPVGHLRKFGNGLASTPSWPQWHAAPSLKQIRDVITEWPASTV